MSESEPPRPGEPPSDDRRRAFIIGWWVVAVVSLIALSFHLYSVWRRDRPLGTNWLAPAGIFVLAIAGMIGPRRRSFYYVLLAAALAVVLTGFVLTILAR